MAASKGGLFNVKINLMTLVNILFYLFLISIPFGTRILLYQFTPGFNEYSSAFLYASDIFLVMFLISAKLKLNFKNLNFLISIFLISAVISVFFAVSTGLAVYNFARLVLLVLLALAVGDLLCRKILRLETIFAVIAGLAVLQSLMGFGQFALQSDLGLRWLGEPVLGQDISGAAKIVVDGVKILRAYGTFPHPNVLAAFLLLGLFSLYYLWLKSSANNESVTNKRIFFEFVNSQFIRYSLISASMFITLLGLALTFSRTAWAIGGLLTIFSVIYFLFSQPHRRAAAALLLVIVASGYASATIFAPYIYTRATISQTEPSVSYRLAYNKMAFDLIKEKPLGIGIGNQVLYSVKNEVYQKFGMDQVWQWQPIHNIYFLIASEVGVLGLLAFLIFLAIALKRTITDNNDHDYLAKVIVIVILSSLLLFGLFDHFLWTLQPGRLMLWLVIGLLLAIDTKSKSLLYSKQVGPA